MDTLTFALAKGRLAELALEKFEAAGLDCGEVREKSRKLIFENNEQGLRFLMAKPGDVPTYVEYGAADIGVVGRDTTLEEKRNIYEVSDLCFGNCRVVVAGFEDAYEKGVTRVATKYPNIAREYFYDKKRKTVEIIKLNGSVELAPASGLADVIVDIVESGQTLAENGLVVLDEICTVSARLVVNPVSLKLKYNRIAEIIERINGR